MKNIDVSGIRVRAVEVAALHEAREKAIEEERFAATKLLIALIEAVKPALPALSNKLPKTKHDVIMSGDEVHEMYGLRLDGNEQPKPPTPGRPLQPPCSPRTALYVLHSGQLVTLDWTHPYAVADVDCVTASWATGEWGAKVDQCARALSDALDAQLKGKAEKVTATALRQAARMRALATLLEK